jgi:hypothetical protein
MLRKRLNCPAATRESGITLIEILFCIAIAGIVIATALAFVGLADERQRFMSDCLQHEPAYQCELKWKQMHPDPVVVPVVVYVPLSQ